jgi:hypothetical protein
MQVFGHGISKWRWELPAPQAPAGAGWAGVALGQIADLHAHHRKPIDAASFAAAARNKRPKIHQRQPVPARKKFVSGGGDCCKLDMNA